MGFSLFELAQDISENTPDAIKNVANKAANFTCGLYRDYPEFFIGAIPNPLLKGGAWLTMELLCQPRNMTPPPPESEVKGGQCRCVLYDCDVLINGNFSTFNKLWGEIVSARNRVVHYAPGEYMNFYEVLCRGTDNESCSETLKWVVTRQSPNRDPNHKVTVVIKKRSDNQPDNCGDSPPRYPDREPPPERLKGDTELVIRPDFAPRVPITFISPKFEFPLYLKVGDFNVNFDAGGVNIDLGGDGSQDLKQDLNEIIERLDRVEADTADSLSNLNDLTRDTRDFNQDFIDEVNKRNNKNPDADDFEKDPPDDEKDKENIEYLYGVTVDLLTIPVSAKMQYGIDAPNLYYAGWFEFKRDDHIFPRQPINFVNNFFKAPEGANGFAYTLAVGYTGQSQVIKNTPKEVVE